MKGNRLRILVMVAVLVAACGGGATAGSTAGDGSGDSATTEAPVATTAAPEDDGETVAISDMPQECIDAFVHFLQAIEPVVDGFDFENASMDDMAVMGEELEPLIAAPTAEMESLDCPDVDATDEEAFAAMIDIAESEAPGTVAYFRWIEDLSATSEGGEGGTAVSGDCETDIAAMQAIVDEGGTMGEMTMTEITALSGLLGSIGTNCSVERSSEFFEQEDVMAFMSG